MAGLTAHISVSFPFKTQHLEISITQKQFTANCGEFESEKSMLYFVPDVVVAACAFICTIQESLRKGDRKVLIPTSSMERILNNACSLWQKLQW